MKSAANRQFWRSFRALPPDIQRAALHAYRLWREYPEHPAIGFKKVGRAWSARVGNTGYRAVAVVRGDTAYWFWIGTHDEYERVIAAL